ncbi:MAG: type II toxin-antitoxin system RelE/ParE family toxin [Gemmatimonadales bacterium]|nr:type II toxin-antitoxin system RelE/ParE family toxin [Gemmatimonadales bacterium]
MRVRWSPLALERVTEIALHISGDRPDAARRWVEGLFTAAKSLSTFPRRGRRVPELDRPEYRELIYGRYRVIYRVRDQRVDIVTVRHGRQLLDTSEIEDSE